MRVFVSYRRTDSRQVAGRLRDHLAEVFGEENVFFDVDSVEFGVDFRDVIRATLRRSDAVVVVIGPNFDVERLAEEHDYVRLELKEALSQRKRIIPVLVEDARMPAPEHLPGLEDLAYFNAAPVRADPDFRRDTARLIASLQRLAAGDVTAADDPTVAMAGTAGPPAAAAPAAAAPAAAAPPAAPPPAPTLETAAPAAEATPPAVASAPPTVETVVTVPPQPPPAPPPSEPEADRRLHKAVWPLAVAALALLVGRSLPWMRFDWGSSKLSEFDWAAEGVLGLALVAAYMAVSIAGGRRPGAGAAMALGAAPAAALLGLGATAFFAWTARDESEFKSIGPGFVLVVTGAVLLLVAAAVAATRARRHLSLPPAIPRSQAVPVAGAVVLGVVAGVVWGQELDDGYLWDYGHVTGLVVRLAIVGLALCAFSGWLRAHGVHGRIGVALVLTVYGAIALEYLMADDTWAAGDILYRIAYFVLVVSATVVPVVAVLLRPPRLGATLFVAWAVTALLADADAGVTGNAILPLALAAGAAYLVYRAYRAPEDDPAPQDAPSGTVTLG